MTMGWEPERCIRNVLPARAEDDGGGDQVREPRVVYIN